MSINLIELTKVCESIFGITPRRYRQLATDGVTPPVQKGKIDFLQAVKSLISYYRNLAEASGEPSLIKAREENILLKNDRLRWQCLIEKKELIPRSEILAEFLGRLSLVKQSLMVLHRVLPPVLVGKEGHEMTAIIKGACREVLERFSTPSGILREVMGNGNGRNKGEVKGEKFAKDFGPVGTSEGTSGREREIGSPVEQAIEGLGERGVEAPENERQEGEEVKRFGIV